MGGRITWELDLGGRAGSLCGGGGGGGGGSGHRGLLFGAAAGAPERRGRRPAPACSVPAAPRGGRGPPPGPGLALGAAAPPLARPARPEGRNRPGLPARPRATSGVAATALRAPYQRLPLAPQADAMKIKDAKKPCKIGVWVRRVGRARQAASGKPLAGRPASKWVAPAGTARGMGAEGRFQHSVPGFLPIPLSSAGVRLPPPWPFLALPPEVWEVQAGIFVSGFGRQD